MGDSYKQRIEELRGAAPLDEAERRELAECLAEAASDAGQSGDFATEHDYVDALGERADSCEDPVVREAYASALATSVAAPARSDAFIETCSEDWLDSTLDRLEALVERHGSAQLVTEYTRALANRVYVAVRTDDGPAISTYTERLSAVADEDDPRQAEQLARGLAYRAAAYSIVGPDVELDAEPLSIETLELAALGHDPEDIPDFDRTTPEGAAKRMGLYINAPDQSAPHRRQATEHADTHYTASSTAEEVLGETISTALDDITALYRRHDTDALAVELARTMRVVAITHAATGSPDRYNTTLERMGDVYEAHPVQGVACQLIGTIRVGLVEDSVRLEHPRMHHWVGRVMDTQEFDADPALTSGIGDCLTMVARQLFRWRNYEAGETAIDRIETLESHAPDRYRAARAEALSTAVTWYLEDDINGYSSRPEDAKDALERLETLSDTDADGVRAAYRDAHTEFMEHYIDRGDYDEARSMYERQGDTPVEDSASSSQTFPLLVFLNAVTDDDGITGDYHRPPMTVPSIESSVLSLLCASGLVGGLGLLYQQTGIGVDLLRWSPDITGRVMLVVVGLVGLYLINGVSSATPPYSVYIRPAGLGFVLIPAQIETPDGDRVFTWTMLFHPVVSLSLFGSALVAPSLLVPVLLVIGCWLLGVVVLYGYTLHLKGNYDLSPAVSSRLSADELAELGFSPREAERLLYDRFTGVDDELPPR